MLTSASHQLSTPHTVEHTRQVAVSTCPTLSFLRCVHMSILYVRLSAVRSLRLPLCSRFSASASLQSVLFVCISVPGSGAVGVGAGGRALDSCFSNSPSLVSEDVDPWRSLENSAWRVQLKVSRSDAHKKQQSVIS